jgi:cytosine deaminase
MPQSRATDDDRRYMRQALELARESFDKGSVPVGSLMVRDGTVIATGRNRTQEINDPTSHGETDCIRNGGLRENYRGVTLYSTLSPCLMCAGAALFLGISRMVVGDRENYRGNTDFLLERGVEVVLLDDPDCVALMRRFTIERHELWRRIVAGDSNHTA